MSKAIITGEHTYNPTLIKALGNSLYVGAKEESILMVLDYCKATGLDPMRKPVHIVPMSVKNPKNGKYEWRDVIMPGIGQYRTNAVNTGQYAGVSEPEFGPDIEETFPEETVKDNDGKSIRKPALKMVYPKWCKVTVKRQMSNGTIVEFVAKELWKENYATAGKWSKQPNAMWQKRPYGQLAKCAEAQALRKAFPEFGAQPTAEEMEGKVIDTEVIDDGIRSKKLSELKEALAPLGIELTWNDGAATAHGKTFQNAKILKELGFTANNDTWLIICENDLPTDTAAREPEQDRRHEPVQLSDLAELGVAIEKLGGTITAPKVNGKGQNWVKFEADKIDETAIDRLKALGFIEKSSGWVRQVDDLLTVDEDDIPL